MTSWSEGCGGSKHPLDIDLRYDDDLMVERPKRRIEVTSTGIEGLGHRAPQDRFLLWEHSYSSNLKNFVYNISTERFPNAPYPAPSVSTLRWWTER